MTNLEKIRAMTVEELKDFILELLYDCHDCYFCPAKKWCEKDTKNKVCDDYLREWLELEVEE